MATRVIFFSTALHHYQDNSTLKHTITCISAEIYILKTPLSPVNGGEKKRSTFMIMDTHVTPLAPLLLTDSVAKEPN